MSKLLPDHLRLVTLRVRVMTNWTDEELVAEYTKAKMIPCELTRENDIGSVKGARFSSVEIELNWLARIKALKPGDRCEFRYPARREWLPGIVVQNGGSDYWQVRDESDVEGCRGEVAEAIYIEHVRLPGQLEAWPR